MDAATVASSAVIVFVALAVIGWLWYLRHCEARPTKTSEGALSTALLPPRFVIFDLETTGLDPTRHEIIEIGAIRVNRDSNVHDTFQTLVRPHKRIPKMITQMTGISQSMVKQDGQPLESALKEFGEFVGYLPLVSFNAEFDMSFLRIAAQRHNMSIHNPVSCALTLARRAWPGRASYRLGDLARDGNLSDEDTHRALGDCKRTLIIYVAAASKLGVASRLH